MEYKQIGLRIRKQREYMGLTREQMAEKLDVSTKFCADIELGNRGMSLETLSKLSRLLHLSCDYILFGKTEGSLEEENLIQMLKNCRAEHLPYLAGMVQNFLMATEPKDTEN